MKEFITDKGIFIHRRARDYQKSWRALLCINTFMWDSAGTTHFKIYCNIFPLRREERKGHQFIVFASFRIIIQIKGLGCYHNSLPSMQIIKNR